jgi:hypothetical protein
MCGRRALSMRFALRYVSHACGSTTNLPPEGKTAATRAKKVLSAASPPLRWIHLVIENLLNELGQRAQLRVPDAPKNYIVSALVFRNCVIHPISGAKRYVVREKIGRRARNGQGSKGVRTGGRKVVRLSKRARSFSFASGSRRVLLVIAGRALSRPHCPASAPCSAYERVVNVHTHHFRRAVRLRCLVQRQCLDEKDETQHRPISQETQPSLHPTSRTRLPENVDGGSSARRGSFTEGRLA